MPSLPFFRITKTDRLCCFHYSGFPAAFRWPRSDRPHRRRRDPCRSHSPHCGSRSRSCSMTTTVAPLSSSAWKTPSSTRTSSGCRPMDGSSNTKTESSCVLPISLGQLQPLCFSAGKARRFLAQRQVAKAQLLEYLQPLTDSFHLFAEVDRGVHIHIHQFRQGTCLPRALLASFTS